jgi:hypothetical protein
MRRTLNRPMFRRGGEVSTPKRGLVDGPGSYAGIDDILATDEDISKYKAQMPEQAPDRSTSDFLINFGLDLISRSPTGNIFQTAATSAKEPFAQMQKMRYAQEGAERDEASDMIKSIMNAKAAVAGSEGVSSASGKAANDQAINQIMTELFTLEANQKGDAALADADFNQQSNTLLTRLYAYTGKNPAVQSLFGNKEQAQLVIDGIQNEITNSKIEITIINAQGQEETVIEGEHANVNPGYLGSETTKRYLALYQKAQKDALGLGNANGGRISKAIGGMMDETMTEEVAGPGGMAMASETIEEPITDPGSGLSFEELRSRLPAEITDDIINILVESPSALVDFAEIQTQTDVDQFNMKYGVNLALPSGA